MGYREHTERWQAAALIIGESAPFQAHLAEWINSPRAQVWQAPPEPGLPAWPRSTNITPHKFSLGLICLFTAPEQGVANWGLQIGDRSDVGVPRICQMQRT